MLPTVGINKIFIHLITIIKIKIMINVLVVDDHEVVRKGLGLIFGQTEDIVMVGATDDAETTIALLHQNTQTDVLLLDIDMPKENGLVVLRRVKNEFPSIRVLVLSMHPEEIYAVNCLKSGAMGYIGKNAPVEEILAAIRKVNDGGIYISEKLSERMAYQRRSGANAAQRRLYKRLSIREIEVLKLLTSGKKNKQVAEELGINEKTVSTYKARLLRKLNVSNMVELINHSKNMELSEKMFQ